MVNSIKRIIKRLPYSRKAYSAILAARRKLVRGTNVVRLKLCDLVLPTRYFIQIQPTFSRGNAEVIQDQKTYDLLHDWPDMRDGARVVAARMLLRQALSLDAGDYAELGTYRGNFARIIYGYKAPGTKLFCFDTFEGFDQRDVVAEGKVSGVDTFAGNFSDTSMELVAHNITGAGPAEDLVLRRGFFPETFAGLEDRRWRFVMLDPDLYEPIKAGLELFWPRLVPGGVLMIDDCTDSYYEGVQIAVDEFFAPLGLHPVPLPDCSGSVVIIKPASVKER